MDGHAKELLNELIEETKYMQNGVREMRKAYNKGDDEGVSGLIDECGESAAIILDKLNLILQKSQ